MFLAPTFQTPASSTSTDTPDETPEPTTPESSTSSTSTSTTTVRTNPNELGHPDKALLVYLAHHEGIFCFLSDVVHHEFDLHE